MDGVKGTVTIGIDYYTDLAREHAIMQEQIRLFKNYMKKEMARKDILPNGKYSNDFLSAYAIANIFGLNIDDPNGYQE